MNKRILSVIVFGAALLSAQAQDGKGGISPAMLGQIQQSYQGTPSDKALRNAIGNNDIRKLALNQENMQDMDTHFSIKVDSKGITDQKSSGRCWLFSSLNVARFVAKQNMGLKEFEFSQNYAMYYDKLERVNYFLKDVAALVEAGEPADSRLMQHLLSDVMGDGGQWTMAMNVYKKYGAVPKDLFPETESSKNTLSLIHISEPTRPY